MYVRQKNIKGLPYHYLVENRREGGRVRQSVLAYLGPYSTAESALDGLKEQLRRLIRELNVREKRIEECEPKFEQYLHEAMDSPDHRSEDPKIKRKAMKNVCFWAHEQKVFVVREYHKCQRLDKQIARLEQRIAKIKEAVVPN